MVEHHPVHNSEVYLLGLPERPSIPPPSPPSPLLSSPGEESETIEELCLDDDSAVGSEADLPTQKFINGAVHVLSTEATALGRVAHIYETDAVARAGFAASIEVITTQIRARGKIVLIGVGKSGHIAKKLVATFNSLGTHATFLHPTEALHGDLGKIGPHDVVLFITFSGKTGELLSLLPHIEAGLPTIVLTSHQKPAECRLIQQRPDMILLPAPIHEAETISFGVSAPTTSTTVALAIGDALAVVASQELHPSVPSVFARNHPGGAIGASFAKVATVKDRMIPFQDIASIEDDLDIVRAADVLRAGYAAPSGWVRLGNFLAPPSRIRKLESAKLASPISDVLELVVEKRKWVVVAPETPITEAVRLVEELDGTRDKHTQNVEERILAITVKDEVIGVMEFGQLTA
ncbi:SIS domain-containing protein [Microdochium bolleyi]|uniref:SIS domain-containing protein n=1 Tax=Microdochium bolleyi TaxID=196109 RepID=A0A136J1J2_9PEZI|nr:SIS domain-containing protein [Microdochium bolleyi]